MQCGPCPPPLYVRVAVQQSVPPGTTVRVCGQHLACEDVKLRYDGVTWVAQPTWKMPAERVADTDGERARATVRTTNERFAGTARLHFTTEAPGDCSCSFSTATIRLR